MPKKLNLKILGEYAEGIDGPYEISERKLNLIFSNYNTTKVKIDFPKRARIGHVTPKEEKILTKITKSINPKKVFEIGTFDGLTSTNIANNTNAEIFTLDLPNNKTSVKLKRDKINDYVVKNKKVGSKIKIDKINQLLGDSATFNFSKYQGFDLCFIDGSHTYDYCKNDSKKAFKIVKSGGIIIWHDYNKLKWLPGVSSYLIELARTGIKLFWIKNTSIVFCIKNK